MNELKLSKRLETVASFVPPNARLMDVGSDHAYLPTHLAQKGVVEMAIAGEVTEGPFESAKRQIELTQLSDIVQARLGNGLSEVKKEDKIDIVTIAGIGGALIVGILEAGFSIQKLDGVNRLILQPNVGEKKVRSWLMKHHYEIVAEKILEENGKIYEIIVADLVEKPQELSEKELTFGLFLSKKKSKVFLKKWEKELVALRRVESLLLKSKQKQEQKLEEIAVKIQEIEEAIG